jgi:WD40 repeat protein
MRAAVSLCLLVGLVAPLGAADPRLVATLKGHTKDVSGVAFYPDGKTLASASWDRTIRLWDVTTGEQRETLAEQFNAFRALAGSRDGSALVAEDTGGEVTLWVKGSNRPVVLAGAGRPLAFSPDGKLLAAGTTLWDVTKRKKVADLEGAYGERRCLAFLPGGKVIAPRGQGEDGQTLILWDVAGRRRKGLDLPADSYVAALAAAPNGRTIAVCRVADRREAVIELWDFHSPKGERLSGGRKNMGAPLAFSPNGRLLAGAGSRGTVVLRDMRTRKEYWTFTGGETDPQCLAFSADGRFLAVGGGGPVISIWEIPEEFRGRFSDLPSFEQADWLQAEAGLRCLALRPDGKELALGTDDNRVQLWEIGKDAPRLTLKGHRKAVWALAYSPDGKAVLSASLDGTARLWDAATGEQRVGVRGHDGPVLAVAFAPDGKSFATGGSDGTARVWGLDGNERRVLEGHKGPVRGLTFTPDGKALLTGGSDGTIKQWDPTAGGQPAQRLQVGGAVMALALTRDGKVLFVADGDGWVTRLDLAGGKSRRLLENPVEMVQALAVSPDGKILALSSRLDQALRLCDATSGKEVDVLDWHTDWVSGAAFSAEGKFLATAGRDGMVRLWRPRVAAGEWAFFSSTADAGASSCRLCLIHGPDEYAWFPSPPGADG